MKGMEIKKKSPFLSHYLNINFNTTENLVFTHFPFTSYSFFVISTSNKIKTAGLKTGGAKKNQSFLRNSLRWKKCFSSHLERKRTQLMLKKRWRATGGAESCTETTATDGPISTSSYFFFWAFSAAFVTLPLVTSLVVTL